MFPAIGFDGLRLQIHMLGFLNLETLGLVQIGTLIERKAHQRGCASPVAVLHTNIKILPTGFTNL